MEIEFKPNLIIVSYLSRVNLTFGDKFLTNKQYRLR